jgi:ABC-2 type transport system permease protein
MVAIVQAITYLLVGLAAGAHFEAGIWGVPVLFALSFAISAGFGAFGLFVGLRSGSGEAVQGLFPLMFVLLFLSSASLPRDLIQQDWFQTAATINPVSYVIEAVRSLFVTGWDGEALALGFIVAISFFVVSMVAASFAMRERLERT